MSIDDAHLNGLADEIDRSIKFLDNTPGQGPSTRELDKLLQRLTTSTDSLRALIARRQGLQVKEEAPRTFRVEERELSRLLSEVLNLTVNVAELGKYPHNSVQEVVVTGNIRNSEMERARDFIVNRSILTDDDIVRILMELVNMGGKIKPGKYLIEVR